MTERDWWELWAVAARRRGAWPRGLPGPELRGLLAAFGDWLKEAGDDAGERALRRMAERPQRPKPVRRCWQWFECRGWCSRGRWHWVSRRAFVRLPDGGVVRFERAEPRGPLAAYLGRTEVEAYEDLWRAWRGVV